MSNAATDLLKELRLDHRNMAILLNLLQDEADRIESDDDIDYELAHEIMRYMTVYSDAVHHPREDLTGAETCGRPGEGRSATQGTGRTWQPVAQRYRSHSVGNGRDQGTHRR